MFKAKYTLDQYYSYIQQHQEHIPQSITQEVYDLYDIYRVIKQSHDPLQEITIFQLDEFISHPDPSPQTQQVLNTLLDDYYAPDDYTQPPTVCPYCHHTVDKNHQKYECTHCHAFVRCHDDGRPMGRLANKYLRQLRYDAHQLLDQFWKHDQFTRSQVYQYVAHLLDIPQQQAHIAWLT